MVLVILASIVQRRCVEKNVYRHALFPSNPTCQLRFALQQSGFGQPQISCPEDGKAPGIWVIHGQVLPGFHHVQIQVCDHKRTRYNRGFYILSRNRTHRKGVKHLSCLDTKICEVKAKSFNVGMPRVFQGISVVLNLGLLKAPCWALMPLMPLPCRIWNHFDLSPFGGIFLYIFVRCPWIHRTAWGILAAGVASSIKVSGSIDKLASHLNALQAVPQILVIWPCNLNQVWPINWCHAIESMESMVPWGATEKELPLVTREMLSQIPMSWEVENLWGKVVLLTLVACSGCSRGQRSSGESAKKNQTGHRRQQATALLVFSSPRSVDIIAGPPQDESAGFNVPRADSTKTKRRSSFAVLSF